MGLVEETEESASVVEEVLHGMHGEAAEGTGVVALVMNTMYPPYMWLKGCDKNQEQEEYPTKTN